MTRWDDLSMPLTPEEIQTYAQKLMDDAFPWAWALVQEPAFIGLGLVTTEGLSFQGKVDWSRLTDLRIFSHRGEWHCWQKGSGKWGHRLRLKSAEEEVISERHLLWGTRVEQVDESWWVTREQRGFSLYIPAAVQEQDLPLCLEVHQVVEYHCLEVHQVVEYHPETHLAYITDAFLTGLSTASGRPLYPRLPKIEGGSEDVE